MAQASQTSERLHILVLDPVFRLPDQPESIRTFEIAARLTRANHRVSVLTTRAALSENTPARVDGMFVDAMPAAARQRPGYASAPATLSGFARGCAWRIWRHDAVDLVLGVDCPPAALFWATLFCLYRGIPLVLDARRAPVAMPPTATPMQRSGAFCGRLASRLAFGFAKAVFATSVEVRDALLSAGAAPGTIVSPAAETPRSDTAPAPLLPEGGKIVLVCGPLTARLQNLLALAPQLAQLSQEPVHLVFSGDGPGRGALEAAARDAGLLEKTVWFMPPASRKAIGQTVSAAAAIGVFTAHADAEASLGLYDALAYGKPLVILDDGPLRDLVEGRGAGIGLPPDPAAAAHEVLEFLRDGDGLRRASQQAAALAAGRFNAERILADVRNSVEQTVAAAPRAVVLRRRRLRAKRWIDVTVSLAGLIVLSPVMLAIALAVGVKMGWPPLFSQVRPGLKGEPFRIYKFRTMSNAKDAAGALLADDARLTPLGKFLRRTSLDELPELFNVLMGDMSLVGPRPLLPEYMPHYTAEQRRRHDLRPGITGWSQVNGRNALSWEDKFKLDVWYVDNLSLWLDLKILLKTVWIALTGHGVSADGHATMPRFDEVIARREGAEDI